MTGPTGIAYSLHFVHVIIVNDVIKGGIKLVQELHNLMWSAGTRQLSKANNVTVTQEKKKICF